MVDNQYRQLQSEFMYMKYMKYNHKKLFLASFLNKMFFVFFFEKKNWAFETKNAVRLRFEA